MSEGIFQDDKLRKINPTFEWEEEVKDLSLTAPTLRDLPLELQEHILMDAVVSEVTDRKLARKTWKESADRVMERLKNVCPEWKYVLTTKLFQDSLHGILDSIPPVDMSMVVLAKRQFSACVTVTALNDEVFVLRHPPQQNATINIYDRHNLKTRKGKIQLPEVNIPWNLMACSMTDCLYLLHQISSRVEIWRISKAGDRFEVSPWITCASQLISRMSVDAEGSVILYQGPAPSTVTIYNSDRSVKNRMYLARRIGFVEDIIPKSNGNFVLVSTRLLEIDREGSVVRECDAPVHREINCAIGIYDWMVTIDENGHVKLLDREFNPMDVVAELKSCGFNTQYYRVNYDRQRNEFLAFETDAMGAADLGGGNGSRQCLTIFHFMERAFPKDAQMSN